MNEEKIKELSHEAYRLADNQSLIHYTFEELRDLIFAELILKSVLVTCDRVAEHKDMAYGATACAGQIRQEFGMAAPNPDTKKVCPTKEANGGVCPLHNLYCQYPACLTVEL